MRWICGDVHGCIFTLKKLLAKIRKQDKHPQFFFVGDYLDRGTNSKETIEYLIELQKKGAVCIRGNHDDVVDYIVNDHSESYPSEWVSIPPTMDKIISWWMRNGFDTTCTSYGLTLPPVVTGPYGLRVSGPDSETVVKELKEAMPCSHRQFLRNLKLWHEEPDFFLFHGYHDPYEELPIDFKFMKGNPCSWLWSRFEKYMVQDPNFRPNWDKKGIFGHTPACYLGADRGLITDKIVVVDTGSFMNKGLAAYCVENNEMQWVESDPRDLQGKWMS